MWGLYGHIPPPYEVLSPLTIPRGLFFEYGPTIASEFFSGKFWFSKISFSILSNTKKQNYLVPKFFKKVGIVKKFFQKIFSFKNCLSFFYSYYPPTLFHKSHIIYYVYKANDKPYIHYSLNQTFSYI